MADNRNFLVPRQPFPSCKRKNKRDYFPPVAGMISSPLKPFYMSFSKLPWLFKLMLGAGILAVGSTGCKDDKDEDRYTLVGPATGAQEVPDVSTPATGTISGTYDRDANKLEYTINWSNLTDSVVMMHFHGPALPGENASPVIDITPATRARTGATSGSATLHDTLEAHLLAGRLYYNIHTKTNRGGEIRGQVIATR
jgi:hypothetical protein